MSVVRNLCVVLSIYILDLYRLLASFLVSVSIDRGRIMCEFLIVTWIIELSLCLSQIVLSWPDYNGPSLIFWFDN